MVSAQELQGNWHTIRGKVKEKWGQLTDDDLQIAAGDIDQLYGRIQQKTGQSKQQLQDFFESLMQGSRHGEHAIQDSTEEPRKAFNRIADDVSGRVRDGYRHAEQIIHDHPAQSLAGVFLAGMMTGLFIGLLATSSRS
jgi:uncharacterized protein YjbJ (UPF0337 family)